MEGAAWDDLRASWSKDSIGATHPDVRLKTSSIPYAEVFWMEELEQTLGVQEYIDQVMSNGDGSYSDVDGDSGSEHDGDGGGGGAQDSNVDTARPDRPRYIFRATKSSLPANSSLHDKIMTDELSLIDHENMKINIPQWFFGAVNTGAPIHHHQHAVNIMVHGRKAWTLLPPRHSMYSKKHIMQCT